MKNDDGLVFESKCITLSKETQRLFDKKIDATKEEIGDFYRENDKRTHYMVFLNFVQVCKYIETLEKEKKIILVYEDGNTEVYGEDMEDNGAILNYVVEHFPESKTAAMFYGSIEYFHPGETGKYDQMSIEELDMEKSKLKNKQGLWNFIGV